MEIYLIRHTKTDTPAGLCYGRTDVPLAKSFADERLQMLKKLPEIDGNCQLFASPLSRCLLLAQAFDRPVTIDNRLQEVDFGQWENQPFAEINPELLKEWTENFVVSPPPNGESFSDLCRRAGHFWDELISSTLPGPILIITHAGVIRALLSHILQLPPANAFKFRVDHGSVHKLRHINQYTYIDYLNN